MSTEAVITIIVAALGIVGSLLAVVFKVGGLAGKIDAQGTALEQHRKESGARSDTLDEKLDGVRESVTKVREQVASLEATARFKVVR